MRGFFWHLSSSECRERLILFGGIGAEGQVCEFALKDENMSFQEGKGVGCLDFQGRRDSMGKGMEEAGHWGICKPEGSGPNEA